MKTLFVGSFLFAAIAAGCAPQDSTPSTEPTADIGTLSVALRSEVNSVAYRLRSAVFQVAGPETATLHSDDAPDAPILSQPLAAGMYTVALAPGFVLEKAFPAGFQAVEAELLSPNPFPFTIRPGGATQVVFSFRTSGAIVGFGPGRVDVSISVLDTSNLPGVTALSAGWLHTCARIQTGGVRCWGSGASGRLGYGNVLNIGDDETPASAGNVNVGGAVVQVEAGFDHTCALLEGGRVRCWGNGVTGNLGYGNTTTIGDGEAPATTGDVNIGGTATQLGVGGHSCVLLASGRVRCWGQAGVGQLGHGNIVVIGDNETPVSAGDIDLGATAVQIAVGDSHTCAVLADGRVRCWGNGASGRLGYGNMNNIGDNETPASAGDVNVGGPVTKVVAGTAHTCALLSTGRVRCWGLGSSGRLGYGNVSNIGDDEAPASAGDVNVGSTVVDLASGGSANHTCAVLVTGRVRCWGIGSLGRLGYGNVSNIGDDEAPASAGDVNVGGPVVKLVASGTGFTCALLETGAVRCWGVSGGGQLGYGNTNSIGDNETPASAGNVPIL